MGGSIVSFSGLVELKFRTASEERTRPGKETRGSRQRNRLTLSPSTWQTDSGHDHVCRPHSAHELLYVYAMLKAIWTGIGMGSRTQIIYHQ